MVGAEGGLKRMGRKPLASSKLSQNKRNKGLATSRDEEGRRRRRNKNGERDLNIYCGSPFAFRQRRRANKGNNREAAINRT